jgi:large subunit ribosomal protein L21
MVGYNLRLPLELLDLLEVSLMQAVFETGGKQYKAAVGDSVNVEYIFKPVGERVELSRVLMISDDNGIHVGKPILEGAKVVAKVTDHDLDRKRVIFKYHPKKRYRVKRGHRQPYTRLLIEEILH